MSRIPPKFLIILNLLAIGAAPVWGQDIPRSIFDDTGSGPMLTEAGPAPIPVPSPDAQKDSLNLINDLYSDDISKATTPALKIELAKKLLGVAEETSNDPAGKYVLLIQAKDRAISSCDPVTAFKSLDELAQGYRVDYVAMKLDLFTALANYVNKPDDQRTVVGGLNHWMDEQMAVDRYDTARQAGALALEVAKRSDDYSLGKRTVAHMKRIDEIQSAFGDAKEALGAFQIAPLDPASNLAAGRYYCLIKGDWKRGLPMLALGDDDALMALANQDAAGATEADAQLALGDGWWDAAEKEKGLAQERIRFHAVRWYQDALPQLAGLTRAKVEKRAEELATQYPEDWWMMFAGNSLINSVGMTLVRIEPGTFLMGSPAGEAGRDPSETQHKVTLTNGFFMATTHVTVGQFAAFVRDTGYRTEAEKQGWAKASVQGVLQKMDGTSWRQPGFEQADDHPVVDVTWNDSVAFCKWLSEKELKHYRLPTEAEWEYTARAGNQTAFYFGNDPGQLGDYAWLSANSDNRTHPVGQKKPNAWGLYDVTGDVWQWCQDWDAAYPDGEATDPRGPDSGKLRVVRGGAWRSDPTHCRTAYRGVADPAEEANVHGFRLVLDSD